MNTYYTTSVIGILMVLSSTVTIVTVVPSRASSKDIVKTVIRLSSSRINVSCGLSSVIKMISAKKEYFMSATFLI